MNNKLNTGKSSVWMREKVGFEFAISSHLVGELVCDNDNELVFNYYLSNWGESLKEKKRLKLCDELVKCLAASLRPVNFLIEPFAQGGNGTLLMSGEMGNVY